jgi:hypothetical protein
MTFDPNDPHPQLPKLTDAEISDAKRDFIADVERELKIRGAHSQEAVGVLIELRDGDRLTVTPRHSGPEVRLRSRTGGRLTSAQAVDAVRETVAERALLVSYGPEPEALLVDRLVSVGIPRTEAFERARGRVVRAIDDGRVEARDALGNIIAVMPPLGERTHPEGSRRDATEGELAAIRDPNRALEAATRAILAERANDAPLPVAGDPEETTRAAQERASATIRGYL